MDWWLALLLVVLVAVIVFSIVLCCVDASNQSRHEEKLKADAENAQYSRKEHLLSQQCDVPLKDARFVLPFLRPRMVNELKSYNAFRILYQKLWEDKKKQEAEEKEQARRELYQKYLK
jgi:hypothetical protein